MLSYVITFVLGFVFCRFLPDIKHRAFAKTMAVFTGTKDPKLEAFKGQVFGAIKNIETKVAELQGTNSIRILEVGVGTGTNFQFYPEGCHLVVVDPNPHFKKYYDTNRAKFPQIKSEEIIVAGGEDMDMVAEKSVDVVVISQVLCSVGEVKKLLQQVHRVLVPGGKFFFLEHIREWDSAGHRYRQMIQDLLTKTGIWPQLFDGCELNRETLKVIEAAGFSDVEASKKHAPYDHFLFQLVAPHVFGTATK